MHALKKDPVTWRYPEIEPNHTGMLRVSQVHEIYYEESGNPKGKPVVFLHGGPGGGTEPGHRRYFNPRIYRIILFDQRGCGKSKPYASLEENTTWDLVKDMEALRKHLKVDQWQVFGGSWGSTLALAYAQTHPERVTELVLRGIFLLSYEELQWFYQAGAHMIYPDAWKPYRDLIPEAEQGDFLAAYHKRLTSTDEGIQLGAAKAWSQWEGSTIKLYSDPTTIQNFGTKEFALAFARIECHYFTNGGFFEVDRQLLRDIHKIRHIPATIIHGRYDMVCPIKTAFDLHEAWTEAEFLVIPDAGHAAGEPGIARALVAATDKYGVR